MDVDEFLFYYEFYLRREVFERTPLSFKEEREIYSFFEYFEWRLEEVTSLERDEDPLFN